ncbi:bifunctional proline dehydrogenase/L-glutamate gamma-semialdehyde dehydrogenase [Acetobacter orientalis]|uniref:Bifunctional proline dehydrogenase/L-glutamate gamma-semialdehyde dehydrogenase n=1 Tax=Acetobacter orientalis TaxID=146474 RepID=A0A2Z5ZF36_9PROT|nr:bifunctional proline dehydrogenase/L-glutamate gamma-semialdehyde dehydrogenase [Acetobacter orientalis]
MLPYERCLSLFVLDPIAVGAHDKTTAPFVGLRKRSFATNVRDNKPD